MNAVRPRICFVVSSAMTVRAFLVGHIEVLSEQFDVDVVLDTGAEPLDMRDLRVVNVHRARIRRSVSPLLDALGVLDLVRRFRKERYASVHSISPKAGLLTAIAAFIARVPVRVHTFTGQVWATRTGLWRALLKCLDRLIAKLDTHLIVDSSSQRDFLRDEGVLGGGEGIVLGRGSISGVDPLRFRPDAAARAAVRDELEIPPDGVVFVFVGRLTREKGVLDLASAFGQVAAKVDSAWLLLVGPEEDATRAAIIGHCGAFANRVRLTGHSAHPERYMAAADVFCLPSHREGFGSVIIEAAAAGLPAIGSRIYGITDAIEDGTTGLLFRCGDVSSLAAAMEHFAADGRLRRAFGGDARARALRSFSTDTLTRALLDFYAVALTTRTEGQAARSVVRPRL